MTELHFAFLRAKADDPKQAAQNSCIWLLAGIRKSQQQSCISLQHPKSTMVWQLSSLSVFTGFAPNASHFRPWKSDRLWLIDKSCSLACSAWFQDIFGSSPVTLNSVCLPLFVVAYSKGITAASCLLFFLLHLFLIFNNFSHFCTFLWSSSGIYSFTKSHSARSCQLI